ncbi:hypothetical protein B0I18_10155 [Taibaiella chishuiensis]|uniref:Uncharacterized protein n=1 Tax=Taibaiella chishuiensis TaxID=1434707 RepID=A0A2P8D9K8_9BACT|nr:hypothetical protein B0I18_10155 [Taibaiella chishuiensis]
MQRTLTLIHTDTVTAMAMSITNSILLISGSLAWTIRLLLSNT